MRSEQSVIRGPLVSIVLNFILIPTGMIAGSAVVAFWWLFESSATVGAARGAFLLLVLYAMSYEIGYKSSYRRLGHQAYFLVVFVGPVVLATLGFFYGLAAHLNL